MLRNTVKCQRYSVQAAISMAAILEYIVADVIDTTIELMKIKKRKRITAELIVEAVKMDGVLSELLDQTIFVVLDEDLKPKIADIV